MTICILSRKIDTRGGVGRIVSNMKTGLIGAGHVVKILEHTGSTLKFFMLVRREARTADIIQALDVRFLALVGFLATRFTSAKFVITGQGTYAVAPLYSWKWRLIAQLMYRKADAVAAVSSYTAREIQKRIPGLQVSVIDPGIDMSRFQVHREGKNTERQPFILSVGSVKARKGYDISLRAFASVKKDIPGLQYFIVGPQDDEPAYVQNLKDLAQELHVADAVEFRDSISDAELDELYDQASLFVLTSVNRGFHFEGFGMVFLEAAAHGLPDIGTRGNGIEDAVEDGKTGLLVAQRDVEATATAIKKLLLDQELRARMSKRAREFAYEHDLSSLAKKYEKLYRKALES